MTENQTEDFRNKATIKLGLSDPNDPKINTTGDSRVIQYIPSLMAISFERLLQAAGGLTPEGELPSPLAEAADEASGKPWELTIVRTPATEEDEEEGWDITRPDGDHVVTGAILDCLAYLMENPSIVQSLHSGLLDDSEEDQA